MNTFDGDGICTSLRLKLKYLKFFPDFSLTYMAFQDFFLTFPCFHWLSHKMGIYPGFLGSVGTLINLRDIKFSVIWNIALVVIVSYTILSPATAAVLDISDMTQFFDHLNSRSLSHLIKGKSDLLKLLTYFRGTTVSASNILLPTGTLPVSFVLYSKGLLIFVF